MDLKGKTQRNDATLKSKINLEISKKKKKRRRKEHRVIQRPTEEVTESSRLGEDQMGDGEGRAEGGGMEAVRGREHTAAAGGMFR